MAIQLEVKIKDRIKTFAAVIWSEVEVEVDLLQAWGAMQNYWLASDLIVFHLIQPDLRYDHA